MAKRQCPFSDEGPERKALAGVCTCKPSEEEEATMRQQALNQHLLYEVYANQNIPVSGVVMDQNVGNHVPMDGVVMGQNVENQQNLFNRADLRQNNNQDFQQSGPSQMSFSNKSSMNDTYYRKRG